MSKPSSLRNPPDATRYGSQSLTIGDKLFRAASYNNCMNVWIDRDGFYMRPQLIFRLFHPMLRIRWDQIARVDVWRALLAEAVARGDVDGFLSLLPRPGTR